MFPRKISVLVFLLAGLAISGCRQSMDQSKTMSPGITVSEFGVLPDGRIASLFTVQSASGMEMRVTNYGGIIVSLTAPNRDGKQEDVVLGFDSLDQYVDGSPYFGAIIGRYGNRIGKADRKSVV